MGYDPTEVCYRVYREPADDIPMFHIGLYRTYEGAQQACQDLYTEELLPGDEPELTWGEREEDGAFISSNVDYHEYVIVQEEILP